MAWHLNTTTVQPNGGFRYYVGDTATWIPPVGHDPFVAYADLVDAVRVHMRARSVPIPPNLDHLIQEQLCARLTNDPTWCNDGEVMSSDQVAASRTPGGFRFTFANVKQATATIADWIISSKGRRVSDEEIGRRASVCEKCPMNLDPAGCASCSLGQITAVASRVIYGAHPKDAVLRSCAVCGCSLKAKVRAPVEVLLRHMPEEQLDRLPDFCWLAKARHAPLPT